MSLEHEPHDPELRLSANGGEHIGEADKSVPKSGGVVLAVLCRWKTLGSFSISVITEHRRSQVGRADVVNCV